MSGADAGGGQSNPPANGGNGNGNGNGIDAKVRASLWNIAKMLGAVVMGLLTVSGTVIGIAQYLEEKHTEHLKALFNQALQPVRIELAVQQQEIDDMRRYSGLPAFDRKGAKRKIATSIAKVDPEFRFELGDVQ